MEEGLDDLSDDDSEFDIMDKVDMTAGTGNVEDEKVIQEDLD